MKNNINVYDNIESLNKAKPVYELLSSCATKEEVETLLPYVYNAIKLAKSKFGIVKKAGLKTEKV